MRFRRCLLILCILSLFTCTAYAADFGDLNWSLDAGILTIGGSGDAPILNSPAEQPWASVRDEIIEVRYADMDTITIPNMQYWFTNCTNLSKAEIPYTARVIGEQAFANCLALTEIFFYYYDEDVFEIAPNAFRVSTHVDTKVHLVSEQQEATSKIQSYVWDGCNRHARYYDIYNQNLFGRVTWTEDCNACGAEVEDWVDVCDTCGGTQGFYARCSCGEWISKSHAGPSPNSSAFVETSRDGCTVHYRCPGCVYGTTKIVHGSSYYTYSGCTKEEYCRDCDELIRSTMEHRSASYTYSQYSASQHAYTYYCSYCRITVSSGYSAHNNITSYTQLDANNHIVGVSCSVCGYSASSTSQSHTDTNSDNICDACSYTMAEKCGDSLFWTFDEPTGELRIYGTGDMWNFTYSTDSVWTAPWAAYQLDIKSAIIEEGCTLIGQYAFKECSALSSVDISDSVTSIDNAAFSGCTSLTSVNIPDSVTSIGNSAFRNCSSLVSVYTHNSVTSIGDLAFYECTSLVSITIPNSVTSIGSCTFEGCTALTSIAIPDGVLAIGNSAFYGCSSLISISIPDGVTSIGNNSFRGCSSLTSIYIPVSVTSLGRAVFAECSSLASVTLPKDITDISDFAFSGCKSITTIDIPGYVTSLGENAFQDCKLLTSIVLPDNLTTVKRRAFANCSSLSSIVIPRNVTVVGDDAFLELPPNSTIYTYDPPMFVADTNYTSSCTTIVGIVDEGRCGDNLEYVLYDNGLLRIFGTGTMWDFYCSDDTSWTAPWVDYQLDITSVTIEEGCTSVGNYAFYECTNCSTVLVPESVTSFGRDAFRSTKISEVNLPSGLTEIGLMCFYDCAYLESIVIPGLVETIPRDCFRLCRALTSVEFKEGLQCIETYAFGYCTSLADVDLPSGLLSIESHAFDHTALTSLHLPKSVASVAGNVASAAPCTHYSVEDGSDFTAIDGVLYKDTSLIAIPSDLQGRYAIREGTTHVHEWAADSSSLTVLQLPRSVSVVEDNSFKYLPTNSTIYTYDGTLFVDGNNYNSSRTTIVEYLDYGQCGDDVYYMILRAGSMNIFGTGTMWDFSTADSRPYSGHTGSVTSLTIESGVTSIGDYALYYLGELDTLSVADSVTEIGDYAFSKCGSIESVALPNAITTIGTAAFKECGSLESINLPTALTSLGASAFEGCYSLFSISLPSGLTALGSSTFSECTSLTSITLSNTLTSIGARCFYNNCSAYSITVPNTVTYIGDYAFATCNSLEQITLPDNVTYMGTHVLEDCDSLRTVSVPATISKLPDYTFADCSMLESVSIPSSVTTIGAYAFQDCVSLRDPTLPSALTAVEEYAFDGCVSVGHLNIPATLTAVGRGAFTNWSEGTTIKAPNPTILIASTHYTTPNTTVMVQSTLKLDYADGVTAPVTYTKWTYETMSLPTPTRTGYAFNGWTSPTYGTVSGSTYTWGTTYNVTDTLTAQWVRVFSVTVPATLPLVVDSTGGVHSANVNIVNNSVSDVQVSSITVNTCNGWTLVPYSTNMSNEKVDSKQLGFRINDLSTTVNSTSESWVPDSSWVVPATSTLTLDYSACVPASTVSRTDESILQIVFVIGWVN